MGQIFYVIEIDNKERKFITELKEKVDEIEKLTINN